MDNSVLNLNPTLANYHAKNIYTWGAVGGRSIHRIVPLCLCDNTVGKILHNKLRAPICQFPWIIFLDQRTKQHEILLSCLDLQQFRL